MSKEFLLSKNSQISPDVKTTAGKLEISDSKMKFGSCLISQNTKIDHF